MKVLLILFGVSAVLQLSNGNIHTYELRSLNVHSLYGKLNAKTRQTARDKAASAKAVSTLEMGRRFIHTGIWTIPPLDPFQAAKLDPIHIHSKTLNGTLIMTNLKVTGGAKFSIGDIQVYLDAKRIDYDISVPALTATVHIFAKDIDNGCLKYSILLDAKITLQNYTVKGGVSAFVNKHLNSFQLRGLEATTKADNVKVSINARVGCIQSAVGDIIQAISDAVAKLGANAVDTALLGYTTEQVRRLIEPDD